jgi:hypothetical protein
MANLPPAPVQTAGVILANYAGSFGVIHEPGGAGIQFIHTFPPSVVRPYLRDGDFNHLVTAWRRGASAKPTAYLVLNGGLGEVLSDAGIDAPDYRDAQPNDAGRLAVPYRGYASSPWDYDASTVAFRVGGNGPNSPQGTFDDLAVWSRVLSFEEMADVYRAGVSIGTACHVP